MENITLQKFNVQFPVYLGHFASKLSVITIISVTEEEKGKESNT